MTAKHDLLAQMSRLLEKELAVLADSTKAATEAATHEESKPENKYDTRGLEASYLAGAQQERLGELQGALKAIRATKPRVYGEDDAIGPTALVELEQEGISSLCFLMPVGAGYSLTHEGRTVVTVTTLAPLGKALFGKRVGDVFQIRTNQGRREYEITAIS